MVQAVTSVTVIVTLLSPATGTAAGAGRNRGFIVKVAWAAVPDVGVAVTVTVAGTVGPAAGALYRPGVAVLKVPTVAVQVTLDGVALNCAVSP
jgi:hypothetical protein